VPSPTLLATSIAGTGSRLAISVPPRTPGIAPQSAIADQSPRAYVDTPAPTRNDTSGWGRWRQLDKPYACITKNLLPPHPAAPSRAWRRSGVRGPSARPDPRAERCERRDAGVRVVVLAGGADLAAQRALKRRPPRPPPRQGLGAPAVRGRAAPQ